MAAMWATTSRANGIISTADRSTIATAVRTEVRGGLDATQSNALGIVVSQTPSTGGVVTPPTIPYVTVTITGNINYIFHLPGMGTKFAINRSVTYRDEAR